MPGCFMRTTSLCSLPSSVVGVKPSVYWLCSSWATRVKVGGEVVGLLQLEVPAARFVGEPPEPAVGARPHHAADR